MIWLHRRVEKRRPPNGIADSRFSDYPEEEKSLFSPPLRDCAKARAFWMTSQIRRIRSAADVAAQLKRAVDEIDRKNYGRSGHKEYVAILLVEMSDSDTE